jgi:hypothetical protein
MHLRPSLRLSVVALLLSGSWIGVRGQDRGQQQVTDACPKQPHTLRAMRNCYRALLVFAPSLDHPLLVQQFNQLKANALQVRQRDLMYVPMVPEGHNQPIPPTRIPTARLSEDELAAMRHRFEVQPEDFLVILIGEDGEEKLHSQTPVAIEKLEQLIDSMPKRRSEMRENSQGEQSP